ncbi:MAG: hypothetical protein WBQ26_00820, partial [Gemmatimonadaceae bacterium]
MRHFRASSSVVAGGRDTGGLTTTHRDAPLLDGEIRLGFPRNFPREVETAIRFAADRLLARGRSRQSP